MNLRQSTLLIWAICLGALLPCSLDAQGVTTSAINGFVTDQQGKPVPGATVTAVHEPSGTRAIALTRPNGQYAFSGLRPGGPYTVTMSAAPFADEVRRDVNLGLGESEALNFVVGGGAVVKMEAFTVAGARTTTSVFETAKISTGSSFDSRDVENLPSVRRNVQDLAQLDPRVVVMNLSQDGELSGQGQNYRYNSFLVDNVQTNDTYGLNPNGFSSQRSPIPFEALEAVSVELNPYDVRRAGFTGALINAVTKSGTNQFHGMFYTEYTDQKMRATHPVTDVRETFRERTLGATLGGPIVPGRLFFFLSYDDFRRQTPPPALNQTLNASQVAQIIARAKTFNYEPGDLSGPSNLATQKTHLAKLDWNISNAHRLSLSYRRLRGLNPIFQFYGGNNTSLSNFWYDQRRLTDSYTAQLFSRWTENLRTEATFSDSKYDGSSKPRGEPFPSVFIQGLTAVRVTDGATVQNGTLNLGTYNVQQANELFTKTRNAAVSGDYSWGDHNFVAGADYQRNRVENNLIMNAFGSYTFSTLASWLSGTGASKTQTVLAPGKTAADAYAQFTYTTLGLYALDSWKPNPRLTVMAGLRFDVPFVPQRPTTIPTTANYSEERFVSAFGIRSNTTNDGNSTISPRVGFNYKLPGDRRTQVRGGAGLFQGTNPTVWLANAYQNRGVTANVSTANATFSPTLTNTATAAPAIATINLTNPDFHSPAVWKANLALDHELPFGGLTFTAEAGLLKVKYAAVLRDLNLRPVGTNPDGRIRYAGAIVPSTSGNSRGGNGNPYTSSANYLNAGFGDVLELGNSDKGGGNDVTLRLERPLRNNWSGSLAWTRSHYTEVSPMTAIGTAQSLYNTRAVFNANDETASTSNYNIANRVVGQLTYRFNVIKEWKAPTTITAIWQGRTGRPYTWVFAGDANGDGFSFNDRFYVPSGPNDPKVRWTNPTERDDFFAFVARSSLNKYTGSVAPRNGETSAWAQTVDLKLTQTVPIFRGLKGEVFAHLLNVGNLLNRKWGRLDEVPFSYRRTVAGTTYDVAAGQYVYTFTPTTLEPVPTSADGSSRNSRWQTQVGMRVRF